ncbi:citrate/2-methylcitrate synthase [Parasporobacterium paucivorans]|uniref:Citrate synthase n=1 Tax=Parasporobacterium paucivorans DSM 15970 TaxID=1122934 RepID=A0A1M6CE80_9FIRM|nr:citrate/2-methylcitrate synthase [Parasporobacterium paucivorans]SHI59074.1 citrate synthase [Parasporobacterium paucivorans DSM 15970]
MPDFDFSAVTPEIINLSKVCVNNSHIDPALYAKYDVKRGLRDINGKGVLTGLTEIAEVKSYTIDDGEIVPCEGKLFYRGIDVEEIVRGFLSEDRFGFEEVTYLLIFGQLPTKKELADFSTLLSSYRSLPSSFVRDVIMKAPSRDMMNTLSRSVLTLYSYDDHADDNSIPNVLRQCMQLISMFPLLSVYGYQAHKHYNDGWPLFIQSPDPNLSTAENILHLLRPSGSYTALEAKILDLALVLHADHGGGNNSTFTTHVVSSTGTDTYSVISAALGSLKGPKHGGANIKVVQMFDDIKENISDWEDEEKLTDYFERILAREAFDNAGLIYGIGHAVYTVSDPRATVFKAFVEKLSKEKGLEEEFALYERVERIAPEVITKNRKMYRNNISTNVDFYSGFVYSMLGLPLELYTPIFAISRISGWSAHRIEELINQGKIIRPAYKNVAKHTTYTPMEKR